MLDSNCAHYPFRPVSRLQALARMLHLSSVPDLERIAARADRLYRFVPQRKSDGTPRECYEARGPLKPIQARIKCLILRKVRFPRYLMGGIADPLFVRDYIHNAQLHTRSALIVNEDVQDFFPSITSDIVRDVWRHFFHFPEAVADVLTALTTRRGRLPQGASTSGYLAHLAFWRHEPYVVEALSKLGFSYSRFADDITLSSAQPVAKPRLSEAIALVNSLVTRSGLRLKRKKHSIMRAGSRMEVNKLVVGSRVSVRPERRATARAMVHNCEVLSANAAASEQLLQLLPKTAGVLGQIGRLHVGKTAKLRGRLGDVRTKLGTH